jgi:hypothetical protein
VVQTPEQRDIFTGFMAGFVIVVAWLANLEANPRFTFHLKRGMGADLPATARLIAAEEERRVIRKHIARIWRRDDVEVMVRYSPLIEVTIDGIAA